MAHIHTEPDQYDFTASAYIVRIDGDEPTIIMHKHLKLNTYLQFGGHVELHEHPWAAVTHEIREESGYGMHQLKLLQPPLPSLTLSNSVLHPTPVAVLSIRFGKSDHYHTDIAYAFVTDTEPADALGEGESSDIRAFTADELRALPSEDIPENVRELSLYILQECVPHWTKTDSASFAAINPL